MMIAVLALLATAGSAYVLNGVASADDQCIQRCIKLENDCRRNSKGQANCDAVASQCMASCRQPR